MTGVRTIAVLALVAGQAGCFWVTTKHEGEELRKDINRIDKSVKVQEDALGTKVVELKRVLDEATKLLARNSADLGAEVDGLVQENARLTGLVNEAKRFAEEIKKEAEIQRATYEERLTALELRLIEIERKVDAKPEQTPEELYAEGKKAFDKKDYDTAEKFFKTLVVKHDSHSLAADGQFHRGQLRLRQKNYQSALGEFQKVFEKYPASNLADDALFQAGEAAEALKWCTDARAYYGLLRQKYPKSELVSKAKAKDKQLKGWAKNKKKCAS